ncbi:MAG: aldo/keto reductase [Candidatus Aenigmarchaeota archaeon]|nr:aldo/keto reductase [Candidatus Aenigmarchaeota archaeon]
MKYRDFGKTQSKVSEVGMGCWAIGGNEYGNSYGSTDDSDSIRAIKRSVELGCNFFDTADVYGQGHSEELLGMALKKVREKVIIATKVGGSYMYGGQWGMSNFSEEYIRFALEKSLQRLQTNYIDIYQLHNPSLNLIKKAEIFSILRKLQKEGKIKHIGISVHTLEEGVAALNYVDVN